MPDPTPDPPIDPPAQPPTDPPQEMPAEPDGPQPWPPPGTDYLTQLTSKADYDQLRSRGAVTFIMRRRGDDQVYPYPWDSYECVFTAHEHLAFLERMDPTRALQLYYRDSKQPESSLIPGRITLVSDTGTDSMKIWVENTSGLNLVPNYMLDATVATFVRERIARCVPFITQFTFVVVCPNGAFDCPLPE